MLNKRVSRPNEQLPAHIRDAEHSNQQLTSPIISQFHAQRQVDPIQKQAGSNFLVGCEHLGPASQTCQSAQSLIACFFSRDLESHYSRRHSPLLPPSLPLKYLRSTVTYLCTLCTGISYGTTRFFLGRGGGSGGLEVTLLPLLASHVTLFQLPSSYGEDGDEDEIVRGLGCCVEPAGDELEGGHDDVVDRVVQVLLAQP